MTAPDIIENLVQRFEQHRDSYRSGRYNETQLRREFLDPFFEALGWDVFNRQAYAEMYKDVIHEDSLEIEGEKKAPDYAFRIGGLRRGTACTVSSWRTPLSLQVCEVAYSDPFLCYIEYGL